MKGKESHDFRLAVLSQIATIDQISRKTIQDFIYIQDSSIRVIQIFIAVQLSI